MLRRIGMIVAVSLAFCFGTDCRAGFIVQSTPDAGYTSSTTLIALIQPNGTDVTSISSGPLSVGFSHIRQVETVPSGWATWGSPPFTESSTPRVLIGDGNNPAFTSLTMSFSQPLSIFGFEVEGNAFEARNFLASFYDGQSLIGEITQSIVGQSGARLFAGIATGSDRFTRLVISSDEHFATAQHRFQLAGDVISMPAPPSMILLGSGAVCSLAVQFIRRRRIAPLSD